ncbi:hypothetical protein MVLG_03225 [Microbotryum lychnidis-dioicae p1A1 Lamole]|uniref:Uncharacterized protein n=1 Tax=Microbotryum lychnidis-dioicae (strain p1A1 Lamole / MvSl-1064) TaxID=683840 RepID=U5H7J8_USTV1|nr:hypothetical protein MVLG_03225 [Microbotryum lychnidis-dioicae p1A1 Lamole]|eukprot:KDE06439.1 hypothetical protein MVLG_03225 [Microbotryum lychnidis-dioicae p1A1 Lamole]
MLGNCNDPSLAYYYLPNIDSPAPTSNDSDGGASSRIASYVPIHVPPEDRSTQASIRVVREPLFLECNLVSLKLLYSLLSPYLPEVMAPNPETLATGSTSLNGNGQDASWIRRLSLEYSIDLQKTLDEEKEPDE